MTDMSRSVDGSPNRRKLDWKVCALILTLGALLQGCVFFHVPYDDVSLNHISELEQRTREVVADGDRGRLTVKASRQFLQQCRAQVGILRVRKSLNEEALGALNAVDRSYAALQQRQTPIRTSNTAELRSALARLHGLGLQHGVWISNPPPSVIPDPDPVDTSDTTVSKKNCERRDEHKHRDHDDDDKHHDKDKGRDDKDNGDKKK